MVPTGGMRRIRLDPVLVALVGLVVATLALAACGHRARDRGPPPRRAFYYWRTTFTQSPAERRALTELGVTRLYVRMFDVEWSPALSAPSTVGPINAGTPAPDLTGLEVVPVVYLRNQVFQQLAAERTDEAARFVWNEVGQRAAALGVELHELQLDCDWTDSTRDRFFAFIEATRRLAEPRGVALSATIRLHQIKYRERTGVPPVERGMLMFYNMGKFSADPEARAIFDAASARPYLDRIADYPLPLDAALPIWSWTLLLRDDVVEGLLQSTDPDELPKLDFLRPLDGGRFQVARSAFLHGTLLRKDDILKIEVTGPEETLAAARMLAPHLATATTARTIALFDLSERNLKRHATDDLDHVFRTVR